MSAHRNPIARWMTAALLVLAAHSGCGDPNTDFLMSDEVRPANRLADEKSPYLLQHADNPVHWYPWGEAAFEAARRLDRPIFLSIGYATCHWCHVMEHESFEDSAVADLMNAAFVNIKVDREERPDVDDVYMTVCQALTNSGGWPLTIIMTPDRWPFFAGTYIPRESRFGRPGMLELIPRIQELWATQRDALLSDADKITGHLRAMAGGAPGEALTDTLLEDARAQLAERFDRRHGGFGERPKFPTPHNLLFLLRQYRRSGDPATLAMVETTLTAMRRGGLFDHVGFGFHRYSTDPQWLVPHFEKMLYDQAMLCLAYLEAWQVTGARRYADTAREIIAYVRRDMTGPGGAFYSAEDADSEGEEGKFYVWTLEEIRAVLDERSAERFIAAFNLIEEGNFADEATGRRTGSNIPHRSESMADLAERCQLPEATFRDWLEATRRKLFAAREARVHPLKDDKILSDWNGLMIAAMARAGRTLGEPDMVAAAERAAEFILTRLRDDNGRLLHRWRDGDSLGPAFLDDHAFMIWGLLELYQAGFDLDHLRAARDLLDQAEHHFWDADGGAFFFTPDDGEALLVRQKSFYDGAAPSGNSVMMLNLLRMARITGETRFETMAERIGRAFAGQVRRYPSGFTFMMCALDFATGPAAEIVLAGEPGEANFDALRTVLDRAYLPNAVVLHRSADGAAELADLAPFAAEMGPQDETAAVWVCRNQACEMPTADVERMRELLDDPPMPDTP